MDVKLEPCEHTVMCCRCANKAKRCPTCKVALFYNPDIDFLQYAKKMEGEGLALLLTRKECTFYCSDYA